MRAPSDPELKIKVDVLEAERLREIREQPYKDARAEAVEAERQKELERLRVLIRDLDQRCPPVIANPSRAPR